MQKIMLIDAVHPEEMRMVITDHKSSIHEFDFTTSAKQQIKGNIYLAKVTRVEPSLQAAFVEYGGGKQGFLPFAEIHPDYYQIPISDRKKLLEEEEAALEELEAENNHRSDRRDKRRRRGRGNRHSETAASNGEEVSIQNIPSDTLAEEEPASKDAESSAADELAVNPPEDNKNKITENTSLAEAAGSFKAETVSEEVPESEEAPKQQELPATNSEQDSLDSQEIETLSSEEEIERPRRSASFFRRYKIQEVIKRNQIMLVQVIKEERGNKGVSLTTYMSLAGRYCVLMPNSPRGGGVSRKINTGDDRKRLKTIISDLKLPKGMSVIIRTAGSNRTKAEIKRDFDYLVKLWNQIREDTLSSSAPALIYEESDLIKRSIRDAYSNEIEEILVEGETAYKEAKAFMKMLVPSHAPRVKQYKGDIPLFYQHNVEEHLLSMHEPVVKLKSGGYLVINPTEALISIDVNSGRSTGERNIEETAYKTNTEAAQEIARQLRLRDLAGLIVIDFIDMIDGKNRRNIERTLKDALRSDRAKIQIGRISPFGLLEMSRQRLRPSITESITRPCSHCHGTGNIRSDASVAIQIIRNLEKEAGHQPIEKFRVLITPSVAVYLLNNMRAKLHKIEVDYQVVVDIQIDPALHEGNFRLEKIRNKDKSRDKEKDKDSHSKSSVETGELNKDKNIDSQNVSTKEHEDSKNRRRGRDRDRDRRRSRDEYAASDSQKSANSANISTPESELLFSDSEENDALQDGENRSSRRRNRNRRRWKRDKEERETPRSNSVTANEASHTETMPLQNEESSAPVEKSRSNSRRSHAKPTPDTAENVSPATATAQSFTTSLPPISPVNAAVGLVVAQAQEAAKGQAELAVFAEPQTPPKPARKGWWQKIME